MASRYFCLVIYVVIYSLFSCFAADTNSTDGSRVGRDPFSTLAPPLSEKTRQTKKPLGLDSKQTSILADGATNKTGKINIALKESKIITGKILGGTAADPNIDSHESHEPAIAPPLFANPPSLPETTTRRWMKASGPLMNITSPQAEQAEIHITRFFEDDVNNSTLKEHNITRQEVDHHVYYNSTLMAGRGKDFWVDLDSTSGVKISDTLSKAHREAVTVKLSFNFPFYGHLITNITIATGGFLYTGDHIHSWLAATQYIAPLMANFDTSLSSESYVKYFDNGTAFTVQWENVALQEMPEQGTFTFQCTLVNTGDIIFVYRNVAMVVEKILDHQHPVKVGVSDAYIIDRTIFFVRRKTIYEYHRVDFDREDIRNWTAIVLSALDTCLDKKDCQSCVSELPHFHCNWCSARCSNGMDRHRQDWLQRGCETAVIHTPDTCPMPIFQLPDQFEREGSVGAGGVLAILFTLCTIISIAWVIYAYRNPHSTAGQILIRYRPSQWTWRRGEARYTAATIHM